MAKRKTLPKTIAARLRQQNPTDVDELTALAKSAVGANPIASHRPLALFSGQILRVKLAKDFATRFESLCAFLNQFGGEVGRERVFHVRTIVQIQDKLWGAIDRFLAATNQDYQDAATWTAFSRVGAEVKHDLEEFREAIRDEIQKLLTTCPSLQIMYEALTGRFAQSRIENPDQSTRADLGKEEIDAVKEAVSCLQRVVEQFHMNLKHQQHQIKELRKKAMKDMEETISRTKKNIAIG